VFAAEAPIHESLLFARLCADWRIEQVGTRALDNIEPVLVKASVDGRPVTRDAAGFYRITGRRLTAVRIPATDAARRTPAQVPADELELAVTRAATDAPGPADALTSRIRAALGWSTVDGAARSPAPSRTCWPSTCSPRLRTEPSTPELSYPPANVGQDEGDAHDRGGNG
jgi:hypothetical protein